jgi:hypothetical protein
MRLIDLTGQRFGRWTALRYAPHEKTPQWLCRCDCGTERTVLPANLKSGKSQSCGCFRIKVKKWRGDLIGRKFGRFLVLEFSHSNPRKHAYFKCVCDCGKEKIVRGSHLGRTIFSCGCWARDQIIKNRTTHGHTKNLNGKGYNSPTYRSWHSMMMRCNNPNSTGFSYWGGRGITVCERWKTFINFLADMGERPAGMSLDRYPNPDGNYELRNCRWATYRAQARNRPKVGATMQHPNSTSGLLSFGV